MKAQEDKVTPSKCPNHIKSLDNQFPDCKAEKEDVLTQVKTVPDGGCSYALLWFCGGYPVCCGGRA